LGPVQADPIQADPIQAVLDSMQARHGFPGATAAYVWTDGRAGSAVTGLADVEAERPMTPDTRMLAASIGKTVVAATAVALAEEEILDLDAPIGRWLGARPWFGGLPNHDRITLWHLLTHRSGLPDHVHLDAFAAAVAERGTESNNPFPPDTLVQFVAGRPALFEPGEGWAYSDTGYILVGLIIEEATGRDYYDLVRARFLDPLGLRHTGPSDRRTLPGLAAGYAADNPFGWPEKTTGDDGALVWHPGIEWTGGGLVSTSRDLARWGAALFGGDTLSETALAQMLDGAPVDPEQPDVRYGMGVAIYRAGPFGPVYGHGGWIPGYVSSLRYYADPGVAIAFQINTDRGLADGARSVVEALEARLAAVVIGAGRRGPR
jgi:D-alanyl-D-alanine carboxypeptidase